MDSLALRIKNSAVNTLSFRRPFLNGNRITAYNKAFTITMKALVGCLLRKLACIYRSFRTIVVILFSSKNNFNQGSHCRLIEYFKNNSFTKYMNVIPCTYIVFEKLNVNNTEVYRGFGNQT